jgi:hypothetical protein
MMVKFKAYRSLEQYAIFSEENYRQFHSAMSPKDQEETGCGMGIRFRLKHDGR